MTFVANEARSSKNIITGKFPTALQLYSLFITVYLIIMIIALFLTAEETRFALIDLSVRVGGPLAAACIAWLGVNHTVINSKRLEVLKEWHADLRWACELCHSPEESKVMLGVTLLDSLDNHPDLEEPEQELIDAALLSITNPVT